MTRPSSQAAAKRASTTGAKLAGAQPPHPPPPGRGHDLVLHVALRDVAPLIWRRLRVPDRLTLHQLHRVLQLAFGWLDYHLYEFAPETAGRRGRGAPVRYTVPDPEWDDPDDSAEARDSQHVTLRALALRRGARLSYRYDFGDDWVHDLTVERVVASPAPDEALPMILDGARAGPPEDVGGVLGYARLLEVLADSKDPEYAETKAWAGLWGGAAYDPERFDPWLANRTLMLVAAWGAL